MNKILMVLDERQVQACREGGVTFPFTLAMGILDSLNRATQPTLIMVVRRDQYTREVDWFVRQRGEHEP